MNVHEYQAKELLKGPGVQPLKGGVARTAQEAVRVAQDLGGSVWVIKAQIHAGGRGQGGGVKLARSLADVERIAGEILGMTLVTRQTGPRGKKVSLIYVEAGCQIARELYYSLLVDRGTKRIALIASAEGGMDIEEVAHNSPEKIMTITFDPLLGPQPYHVQKLAHFYKMEGSLAKDLGAFVTSTYKTFMETDASMMEINPLVVTSENTLVPLDAKMAFDDNALYRHANIESLRDLAEEEPSETLARSFDLNYVKLDGTIGCMVNGAGLAMATMDIIQYYGGTPANFLDVGGGADQERVREAFKIILSDPNVKGILVNIFGGIMKCDVIAEGIMAAVKGMDLKVPLVVRLEGTNVEEGKNLLKNSGLAIITADDLADAAQKIVQAVEGRVHVCTG